MKTHTAIKLALAAGLLTSAHGANVVNYWDFDGLTDKVGSMDGVAVGTPVLATTYGNAYAGSGNSLSQTAGSFSNFVRAGGVGDFDFGTSDFAISYWYYDDQAGDGDNRQMRVLDSLAGTTTGISLGTNTNTLTYRFDDSTGTNSVNSQPAFLASDQWLHVTVNMDRTNDLMSIYVNGGSPYHTESIASLTTDIYATQAMEIGVINGGTAAGHVQSGALDDLAFYDGTLSAGEITGLANGTLTPDQIPEPSLLLLLGLGTLGLRRRR